MIPSDPHNLAIWLLDNLEEVHAAGEILWEGRVPESLDFTDVQRRLEAAGSDLVGICNDRTRTIGFCPRNVGVYADLAELIVVVRNRRGVPARFALRSPRYHHPATDSSALPDDVAHYTSAVDLWVALKGMADIPQQSALLFVASHDAQLEIRPDFTTADLRALPSLGSFAAEFAHAPHQDQKLAVVRTTLIDHFKPRRTVTMGEVLGVFESIATDARRSFAMYMTEFSVKKVLGEVERQNLEDTLSLNKTLSDIQNQLLALPAAMLLAGATIQPGHALRNWGVVAGMLVFCTLIWLLVGNQRHSVEAIRRQIARRKAKVQSMPVNAGDGALTDFMHLEIRATRQRRTLNGIAVIVVLATLATIVAVLHTNHGEVISAALSTAYQRIQAAAAIFCG